MSEIKIKRKTHKNKANLECVWVIGVFHKNNEIRFVTGFEEHKVALWTENEKPYEFESKNYADDIAWGYKGKAKGVKGSYLVFADWEGDENNYWKSDLWTLKGAKMVRVDGVEIKEDTYYTMNNGEVVETE